MRTARCRIPGVKHVFLVILFTSLSKSLVSRIPGAVQRASMLQDWADMFPYGFYDLHFPQANKQLIQIVDITILFHNRSQSMPTSCKGWFQ
jgi:hypothetical protein